MSTAQSLIDDVRARIVEANADFFTDDVPILRWLNQGYKNFCLKTFMLEKTAGLILTANQYEYNLPTDCIAMQKIRWHDQYDVVWRDQEEFARIAGFLDNLSDRPRWYTLHPGSAPNGKIRFYYIPNTTAPASALAVGINASATSMTLDDASLFPSRGRILIASEQILYFAKSGNVLSQCVRGDGFTTAQSYNSHSGDVTYYPMTLQYSYMPPEMTTGGSAIDCRLPSWYDEAIINYAAAVCFRAKDKYETADRCTKIYRDLMDQGMQEVVKSQRDRLPCIKDESVIEGM
jgi:hypothetical protein